MRLQWWLLLVLLCLPSLSEAACSGSSPTLTAASAAYTDVNDCVTAATDGDTINVPSGTVTWATKLTWTNKSISLVGAGIGNTVIDANVATYPCLINLTTKATGNTPAGLTRISGFTFKGTVTCGDGTPNTGDALILISGSTANVRLDHNRIEAGTKTGGLSFTGYVRGVVDHNEFTNTDTTANRHPTTCGHGSWESVGSSGDKSWAVASTKGTAQALYFEDNTIDRGAGTSNFAFTDDFTGCRSVYRFNTFTNYYVATHGTESGGRIRGFRHIEVYRNDTTWTKGAIESIGGLRGGTGMLFDNDVSGTGTQPTNHFVMNTYRRDATAQFSGIYVWGGCGAQTTISSITRSGTTATVTTTGEHSIHGSGSWVTISGATGGDASLYNGTFIGTRTSGTTFTYTLSGTPSGSATGTLVKSSPFDGNTDSTGYKCADQAGSGMGTLFSGSTPATITPVSATANAVEPVYCINNTVSGTLNSCIATGATDVIVNLREYFNQNNSYNGTTQNGIGRGARASRPASSDTLNDGWWATDDSTNWNTSTTETHSSTPGADGCLDVWNGSSWDNCAYVPYTYPHPLVGGGASSSFRISGGVQFSGGAGLQ